MSKTEELNNDGIKLFRVEFYSAKVNGYGGILDHMYIACYTIPQALILFSKATDKKCAFKGIDIIARKDSFNIFSAKQFIYDNTEKAN
jgi:hypothetical protein